MGFMLDNLNFRSLQPQAQADLLKRIPLFSPPGRPAATPPSGTASPAASDAARIARLLASF